METTRYRIVFRGEVGLGYTQDEIRENLARLTRWDDKKIEQLLSSSHCVIKSDLDAATAERMLNSLNNTGVICRKEAVPNASPGNHSAAAVTIAVVGRESLDMGDANQACPKCGHSRDGGESCSTCGVVFARFAQSRAGAASDPVAPPPLVSAQAVMLQRSVKRRNDPLARLEERHPLGYYYGKLLLVVVGALLLRTLYVADLALLILLLLPLGFALYLGALSAVVDRPFDELLNEHFSLLPLPLAVPEERATTLPFATYGLLLLHFGLYLGLQGRTPVEILQQNWFFPPPLDSSAANLVISALVSLFFHSSGWAFLGGIFFLWVIGATLERRIGSGLLVGFYLLGGLLAAALGVGVQQLLPGMTLQIVGTGGALATLLGVFAICSHRRLMTFPLPFGRLESFVVGTPYQVRWSSLLVVGLFVFADLGAPLEAVSAGRSALGAAILCAGFFIGLSGAYALGLGSKAEEEDEALPGGPVFAAKEATLRQRLAANPDHPDLLVQLARVVSAEKLSEEGRQLYRRAITARLSSKPKEATEIYREFNRHHQEVFEPKLTLRLASLYLRQGDTGMAASVLSSVCDDERTTSSELEKALYQYAVALAKLREIDAAQMALQRFSQTFAESSLLPKLREVVYDAAHGEQG
jgi:membrane associated rhomboid family serine protease